MAEQLSAFQNAQSRTDEQKRALLAAIAQHGSAGKQEFDRAQQELGAGRSAAVSEAAQRAGVIGAPAEYIAQARQQAGSGYDMRQADLAQNRAAFGADIERQGAANEQYFSQLGAAIPITESRTRAAVEQIIREQQEAEQERLLKQKLQEQELADRDEQRAFEREDRDFQREMRGVALAQARAGGGGGRGGGRGPSLTDLLKLEDRSKDASLDASRKFVMANIQKHASKPTQDAFYKLTGSAKSLNEALGYVAEAASAGALKSVSVPALQDWIRRYFEPSDDEIGHALGTVPIPQRKKVGPKILGAQPSRMGFR